MRSGRRQWGRLCIAVAVLVAGKLAWGLSESEYGNNPVNGENYKDWPGIVKVANDPYRVYRVWTNGNEDFWFHGDANAINAGLENYWRAELERYQIVLLPGPGQTVTYNGMTVVSNYRLHIVGGIAKAYHEREAKAHPDGEAVDVAGLFDLCPTFYIYVNQPEDLQNLKIPVGVDLVGPSQMRQRCLAGLRSQSTTLRGYAAGLLASVDAHNPESAKEVATLLDVGDDGLASMAVYSLRKFGANARPVLGKLEQYQPKKEQLAKAKADAVMAIKEAKPRAEEDKQMRELSEKIDAFVETKSLKRR